MYDVVSQISIHSKLNSNYNKRVKKYINYSNFSNEISLETFETDDEVLYFKCFHINIKLLLS